MATPPTRVCSSSAEALDERPGAEHTVGAVVKRLNAKMYGAIDAGRVFVVEPPSIPVTAPVVALSSSCSTRAVVCTR